MASPPPSIIRVIDLETTGQAPPAHGVCEIGWQDVALGVDGRWELLGEGRRAEALTLARRLMAAEPAAAHAQELRQILERERSP